MHDTITKCRACGFHDFNKLFSLGDQYVSDFVTEDKILEGNKVPIDICQCTNCTLIQQRHTAPQDFLYTRHYWYRSGTTETMREELKDVVDSACNRVILRKGDVVLDIGSNDGTLLRSYQRKGVVRVGVEPAKNLEEEGSKGIDYLINDFWTASTYYNHIQGYRLEDLGAKNYKAKIITACGMFYDLDNPFQFIKDISLCLHHDGVFVAQLMCAKQTWESNDVGNFAHEHLEFYTLSSLRKMLDRCGLYISEYEENNVNGGSYRLYIKHIPDNKIYKVTRDSHEEYLCQFPGHWDDFVNKIEDNKKAIQKFIKSKINEGKHIWVYGASTKGNVILQYLELDHTKIVGAIDKSEEKIGKYTIGTGIPIFSEEEGRAQNPDYMLVLPYAFINEFVEREKNQEWRKRGGKFIVPLPKLQVI